MDTRAIFQKTQKGHQEIATRSHRLPSRERSVLILVDGKNTREHVLAQARHFGNAEQFFDHLLAEGFIEAVPELESALAAEPPASEEPPPRYLADFASAKPVASRLLLELLGPDAERLALRIEKADEDQLPAVLEKAREAVRSLRGARHAERYWNEIQAVLDAPAPSAQDAGVQPAATEARISEEAPTESPAERMAAFMATKTFAARFLLDLLGPEAESLTKRVERAQNEGQLLLLLERCRDVVREARGEDSAERFWALAQAKLSGHG